jgi:hypothetical protein
MRKSSGFVGDLVIEALSGRWPSARIRAGGGQEAVRDDATWPHPHDQEPTPHCGREIAVPEGATLPPTTVNLRGQSIFANVLTLTGAAAYWGPAVASAHPWRTRLRR